MKRNNKKGFTIVELTIVIAVIAILAAVLIPTFSSVVDKANQSADVQLIRQANVVLQAATADGSSLSEKDAIKELENNSIKLDKPSQTDCVFYYLESENRYVIFDTKEKKMTYPEDMVEKYKDKAVSSWLKYDFTLDFQVDKKFVAQLGNNNFKQHVDTGVKIDWNNDFTITETFDFKNDWQMPFGNWLDSHHGFNIEINSSGNVHVYIRNSAGGDITRRNGGYITQREGECKLTFQWNAKDHTFTLIIKQGDTVKVNYTNVLCEDLSGTEQYTMRLGTADWREGIKGYHYKDIHVKTFKITYTVGYGENLTLPNVTDNIDNYGCKGWYTAPTDGRNLENTMTMPAADTTIYAQWTQGTNE